MRHARSPDSQISEDHEDADDHREGIGADVAVLERRTRCPDQAVKPPTPLTMPSTPPTSNVCQSQFASCLPSLTNQKLYASSTKYLFSSAQLYQPALPSAMIGPHFRRQQFALWSC